MPRYVGGIPVSTCQTNMNSFMGLGYESSPSTIASDWEIPNMIHMSHTIFDMEELQMLSVVTIAMSVCWDITKQSNLHHAKACTRHASHFCMYLARGHHLPLRGFVPTSGRLHLQSSIVCHCCTSVLVANFRLKNKGRAWAGDDHSDWIKKTKVLVHVECGKVDWSMEHFLSVTKKLQS